MNECKSPLMGAAPTPLMMRTGVFWPNALNIVNHCLNLIESQGDTCLDIVRDLLLVARALCGRDLVSIFTGLNELRVNGAELIAAIRKEFEME